MFSILAVALSVPLLAAAASLGDKVEGLNAVLGNYASCPTAKAVLTFPPGQTNLTIPTGQVPNHILLGTGVQNYTCSASGTYTYAPGLNTFQKALWR
jgi:hypothetical protein